MSAIEVSVPDIGDTEDAEIVEILVAPGDAVEVEDTLLSIESDKATLEIPSPRAGIIESLAVKVGDRVNEGTLLLILEVAESGSESVAGATQAPVEAKQGLASSGPGPSSQASSSEPAAVEPETPVEAAAQAPLTRRSPGDAMPSKPPVPAEPGPTGARAHASPLVRRQARELGVDLSRTRGSGPHGRVLSEDVKGHVRSVLSGAESGAPVVGQTGIDPAELERFGPIEIVDRPRIRRTAARNLQRSWSLIPHVTQHDEADVTNLEAFRRDQAETAEDRGVRLSLLPFVMKACVQALRGHPDLRSVLSADGSQLYVRQSSHLGVAVDTEHGLLVPVVRDVEDKGLLELAGELGELARRARDRKLALEEMQGAVFSISSLGGIAGTGFTPIVNWPEVAILGVSRMQRRPVWDGDAETFVPRLLLPLSLSYDHRVVDGATAARFTREIVRSLEAIETLLL